MDLMSFILSSSHFAWSSEKRGNKKAKIGHKSIKGIPIILKYVV
jgi:hypothetical protein